MKASSPPAPCVPETLSQSPDVAWALDDWDLRIRQARELLAAASAYSDFLKAGRCAKALSDFFESCADCASALCRFENGRFSFEAFRAGQPMPCPELSGALKKSMQKCDNAELHRLAGIGAIQRSGFAQIASRFIPQDAVSLFERQTLALAARAQSLKSKKPAP